MKAKFKSASMEARTLAGKSSQIQKLTDSKALGHKLCNHTLAFSTKPEATMRLKGTRGSKH